MFGTRQLIDRIMVKFGYVREVPKPAIVNFKKFTLAEEFEEETAKELLSSLSNDLTILVDEFNTKIKKWNLLNEHYNTKITPKSYSNVDIPNSRTVQVGNLSLTNRDHNEYRILEETAKKLSEEAERLKLKSEENCDKKCE